MNPEPLKLTAVERARRIESLAGHISIAGTTDPTDREFLDDVYALCRQVQEQHLKQQNQMGQFVPPSSMMGSQ
jgi:hypothetical protein